MLIALLTDFGTTDAYVGVMKGVILNIAPSVQIVDITHAVQPQNVRQAALTLKNAYSYFPVGTIFVVVVDPGVGSTRRSVAVRAGGYTFVAPDNGVLSYVLEQIGDYQAVTLANAAYQLTSVSATFHGRDIFAPAAAHLAAGVEMPLFGDTIHDLVKLPKPLLRFQEGQVEGEVLDIDHFGNVVTSIGPLRWAETGDLMLSEGESVPENYRIAAASVTVVFGGRLITGISRTYSQHETGTLLALVGSSGSLELAVNQGSAAAQLGASIGDRVTIRMG